VQFHEGPAPMPSQNSVARIFLTDPALFFRNVLNDLTMSAVLILD
jgi:hypothetical protein